MDKSNSDKYSVLIVDDDPSYRAVLRTIYSRANYSVTTAEDGEAASRLLESGHYDLVITDLQMPNIDGLTLYRIMQRQYPSIRVILMGANPQDERYRALFLGNRVNCLSKPFRRDDVLNLSYNLLHETSSEGPPIHNPSRVGMA